MLYFLLSTILNILFNVDVTTTILIFWRDVQTQYAIMVQMLWVAFAARLPPFNRARCRNIYAIRKAGDGVYISLFFLIHQQPCQT